MKSMSNKESVNEKFCSAAQNTNFVICK